MAAPKCPLLVGSTVHVSYYYHLYTITFTISKPRSSDWEEGRLIRYVSRTPDGNKESNHMITIHVHVHVHVHV